MKPIIYTTDEKTFFRKKELFYNNQKMDFGCNVVVSDTPSNENFGGFGVALTGSSCYELSIMPEDLRKSFLDDIYGKNGLGLSVGRISIGSCDYSTNVYSYCDKKDDIALESFSLGQDMDFIVPMVKEVMRHNPDIKLFATPWSPPGWMKTSGTMYLGYMRREYIDCYADYFIKFLDAYKAEGIPIYAVTPQNEPEVQQAGKSVACIWHPDIESEFVSVLRSKLRSRGMDTEIWLYDHCFIGWARVLEQLRHSPQLINDCNAIAFHYYEGYVGMINNIKKEYPQIHWNFTEGGPRLFDNYGTDWCKWSITMSSALSAGCDTFTGWNLLLDECGGPNIGPFSCAGLATLNSQTNELTYSGQYRAFKHFSTFIKRGAKIYPIGTENCNDSCLAEYPKELKPIKGVFAVNTDGSKVLQLINENKDKVQAQYFHDKKWWYIELMPNSVASIIFEK